MRIISGKYKGRKLEGFNIDGTRPTMDRIKESLFAIIQDKILNSCVLDLFAGSGALGIEAISNGAKVAYLIDNNSLSINTINKNISGIENIIVEKKDYKDALKSFKDRNIKFDIIFLDPPYKLNLINDTIRDIVNYNLLNNDGIIVCEYENEKLNNVNLKIFKQRKYGNKNIIIYKFD